MTLAERHAAALAAVPTYAEGMTVPRLNEHFDGVRRILGRHRPLVCGCPNPSHHDVCSTCMRHWPCPDWLDAAAGLEVDRG